MNIPTPSAEYLDHVLAAGSAFISIIALFRRAALKQLTARDSHFATKSELHESGETHRNHFDSRLLSLTEKIDHLGTGLHARLNQLESGLARVDERTKR
jgi:hypothetical protein